MPLPAKRARVTGLNADICTWSEGSHPQRQGVTPTHLRSRQADSWKFSLRDYGERSNGGTEGTPEGTPSLLVPSMP